MNARRKTSKRSSALSGTRTERLLKDSPSPHLARANLQRLIDVAGEKSLARLPRKFLPNLVRLLGSSEFLSEILIREGEGWPELFSRQLTTPTKSCSDHLRALEVLCGDQASGTDVPRQLRLYKKKEFLRIGARDLNPSHSVDETVAELSSLAEASLEIAYRFCRGEVEAEFGRLLVPGTERENGFVILGMGKLGGGELNFSSDIDIIYLYEDEEGESLGGARGKVAPREFFSHLAERITSVMGEVTEEGFVFRTDLRLRPLGRNGPIVQSVHSALLYYESWGQSWERAALIKARPVAGDRKLGLQFLRELEPFVYRRYLDFTTVEDLRAMKWRIERELVSPENRGRNVKLGIGGIREIEFFAQALQLVNGGYQPAIRDPNTLRALSLLAAHGYIPQEQRSSLARAYRFLRDVEHKIQMVQEAHEHSIPKGEEEEAALARRMGYRVGPPSKNREKFWSDYHRHTRAVNQAFGELFYGAQEDMAPESSSEAGSVWHELEREERVVEQLHRLGFADPARAYENLLAVRDGAPYSPPSPRRLKVMGVLGPALLAEIAKSGSPDQALFNLAEFSHRVGARTGFLSLLAENPETMRLMIRLFATSQFLSDLFLKRPELLDVLIRADLSRLRKNRKQMLAELLDILEESDNLETQLDSIRHFRSEEFIRIGLHDLGGELKLEEVLAQLSGLAEACLEGALRLSLRNVSESHGQVPGGQFAVLGMGKLGGREIDYKSDLDLIFIYRAPDDAKSEGGPGAPLDAHEYYVRVGQKLLTFLSAPTAEGVAYPIDMRLRPSGRFGPLVTSLAAFRDYHQRNSELWERQALTKARWVAGDAESGREAERAAAKYAFRGTLTKEQIAEIHRLRMRMEKELARENPSQFNLKRGKGGLVDIEFLAQMLQLSYGKRFPALRKRGTLEALEAMKELRILKRSEYGTLADGYLFLRRLDHRLRLEKDQSLEIVEREPEKVQGLALALGYRDRGKQSAGDLLLREYERVREEIRRCYDRFFGIEDHTLQGEQD